MLASVSAGPARADGDPANGVKIFKLKCVICHSTQAGQNKVGPSLAGAFGRKAATALKRRWLDAGREVETHFPPGDDWDEAPS